MPGEESPQPAGRNARTARFFLDFGDRFLVVDNLFLEPIEFGQRTLPIAFDNPALRRVVAIDEIGGQRVDPSLHRVQVAGVAVEREACRVDAFFPVLLVLGRSACGLVGTLVGGFVGIGLVAVLGSRLFSFVRFACVRLVGVLRRSVDRWRRYGRKILIGVSLGRRRRGLAALFFLL